jgi:hypothetical protein
MLFPTILEWQSLLIFTYILKEYTYTHGLRTDDYHLFIIHCDTSSVIAVPVVIYTFEIPGTDLACLDDLVDLGIRVIGKLNIANDLVA